METNTRILIVDQDEERREKLAGLLKPRAQQVLGACSGNECLRFARAQRPHLILIDAGLPDVSGTDLLRDIRRDPELHDAFLVLLLGEEAPAGLRARALETGADACLPRSLSGREAQAQLEALLRHTEEQSALKSSLEQWKGAFDAIQDPLYVVDRQDKVQECNLALSKFLGRRPSEIVGRPYFTLLNDGPIPDSPQDRVRQSLRRETLILDLDDRWVQLIVDPLLDENAELVGTVHTLYDVTERRRDEQILNQVRDQLQRQLAEAKAGLESLSEHLHDEMIARQEAEEALSQAHTRLEKQAQDHSAILSHTELIEQSEAVWQQKAESLDEQWQAELAQRQQVEATLSGVRTEWEHQVVDLRGMLDGLRQALHQEKLGRMEALSRMAGGLALQLNDPLAAILGHAELGLSQVEPTYPGYAQLAEVQRACRRVADWTKQLAAIPRRDLTVVQPVDLNALILSQTKVLRRLLGEHTDLELDLAADLPPVLGESILLEQALHNLAEQARQAMPEGGEWRIRTETVTVDESHREQCPEACAGPYVLLSLTDTGPSPDEATRARIFEPFSMTGQNGPGSGLCLAEVYAIARQHGGWAEALAPEGGGTRFELYLQAGDGEP